MSWDVHVFDFKGAAPLSIEEIIRQGKAFRPPVMGTVKEIRAKIASVLPAVDWSQPFNYTDEDQGYVLEFGSWSRNAPDDEPIEYFTIAVRGGGNPMPVLVALAKPNGWSLLDGSTAEYLDLDNPSPRGWLGFQGYRDCSCPANSPGATFWVVKVFHLDGPPPPTLDEAERIAAESGVWALGTKRELQAKIEAVLPIVDRPESYSFTYAHEKEGYVVTFHIGLRESDEPIGILTVSVRGTRDPYPVLAPLAKTYGWSLYNALTKELLDLDKPRAQKGTQE